MVWYGMYDTPRAIGAWAKPAYFLTVGAPIVPSRSQPLPTLIQLIGTQQDTVLAHLIHQGSTGITKTWIWLIWLQIFWCFQWRGLWEGTANFWKGSWGGGTPSITPKQQNMCEHCLKLSAHGIDFSYAGGNGWGIHGGAAFRWGVGERHILGRWGSISPTGVNPTMGIISKIHNRAS